MIAIKDTVEVIVCKENKYLVGMTGEVIDKSPPLYTIRFPKKVHEQKDDKYLPPRDGLSEVVMRENEIIKCVVKRSKKMLKIIIPGSVVLSLKQCAARYGVSVRTWERWMSDGKTPPPIVSKKWLMEDIEAWERNHIRQNTT